MIFYTTFSASDGSESYNITLALDQSGSTSYEYFNVNTSEQIDTLGVAFNDSEEASGTWVFDHKATFTPADGSVGTITLPLLDFDWGDDSTDDDNPEDDDPTDDEDCEIASTNPVRYFDGHPILNSVDVAAAGSAR